MTKDFGYKKKNDWRRWAWNRIFERTNNPREALVVYLSGPLDIEGKLAIEKGFCSENLISIEQDKHTLQAIRKGGRYAIGGEVSGVLMNWPDNWPIDVLSVDACNGLGVEMQELAMALIARKATRKCVVCLNMLRGRDAYSNLLRESLLSIGTEDSHRGYQFLFGEMANVAEMYRTDTSNVVQRNASRSKGREIVEAAITADYGAWDSAARQVRPEFYTYKSSATNYYDSVVMSWDRPSVLAKYYRLTNPDIAAHYAYGRNNLGKRKADHHLRTAMERAYTPNPSPDHGMIRRISAARAWHTRRGDSA